AGSGRGSTAGSGSGDGGAERRPGSGSSQGAGRRRQLDRHRADERGGERTDEAPAAGATGHGG
ncbi:MAG: hypothetical protein JWM64_159, partial [Frankiales bacterium]|nr:hypothetical protein [Frankiales bacterium]